MRFIQARAATAWPGGIHAETAAQGGRQNLGRPLQVASRGALSHFWCFGKVNFGSVKSQVWEGGIDPSKQQPCRPLVSQKVFLKSFGKSQLRHKSVNVSFVITNIQKELTNSCENRLLQNDWTNTFYEIMSPSMNGAPPSIHGSSHL